MEWAPVGFRLAGVGPGGMQWGSAHTNYINRIADCLEQQSPRGGEEAPRGAAQAVRRPLMFKKIMLPVMVLVAAATTDTDMGFAEALGGGHDNASRT